MSRWTVGVGLILLVLLAGPVAGYRAGLAEGPRMNAAELADCTADLKLCRFIAAEQSAMLRRCAPTVD